MSLLDEHFGPPVVDTTGFEVAKTNWPTAPIRLRKTLDAFQSEAGFDPGPTLKKMWRHGAHLWVEEFGEDATELLVRTIRHMRNKREPLVIKSPSSCIVTAYHLQSGANDSDSDMRRRRYVSGEYADLLD